MHIDASASQRTRDAMEGILRCYREKYPGANVFSIRFPIKVFWGSVSILEASWRGYLRYNVCTLDGGGWGWEESRGAIGCPKSSFTSYHKGPYIKDVLREGGRGVGSKADIVREVAWI